MKGAQSKVKWGGGGGGPMWHAPLLTPLSTGTRVLGDVSSLTRRFHYLRERERERERERTTLIYYSYMTNFFILTSIYTGDDINSYTKRKHIQLTAS